MTLFKKNQNEKNPDINLSTEYQYFLLKAARQFIDVTPSDIDPLINKNLKDLVNTIGTERAFVYKFMNYDTEMKLKFHFYKPGLKSKIDYHQQINSDDFKELIAPIQHKMPYKFNTIEEISEQAYTIKSILEVEETKSFLACPLILNDAVIGFLGTDTVSRAIEWTDEQVNLLNQLGEFICSTLKRKKAVDRGLNIEQKLKTLFDKIEDMVYVTSPEGQFLEINPAGLKLFGYTENEILKISIPENLYANPEDWIEFKNKIDQQGFVKDHESTLITKDGEKIHVIETTTVVKDDDDKIISYEGILRDVTKRKKLEQQLFQAQKMESIGMLAGGIAHDFNNILTAILGLSDMLLLKMDEKSPFYRDVSGIHSSGKRAENLVKQLLGFSRKQIISAEVINLNNVISELSKMITRLITEDIEVEIKPAESLRYVLADPTQIQQILVNLVVNAGHAIRDNKSDKKKITIRTDNVFLDRNFTQKNPGSRMGKYIMIAVADTGIGMDEKTKDQVFEPFFTTKGDNGGTGLGLATVYGIVKQNKGYILVESEPGKGSEFQIYWPVTDSGDSVKESYKESAIRFANEANRTILVVEDDPAVRELAGTALRKIGYNVFIAENGKKALGLIKEQNLAFQIDLLFSDIVMPEMNGEELAEKVLEMNSDVKILLSSGYTRNQVFEKNATHKNYSFLFKPYTVKKLEKTIRLIFDNTN